MLEVFNIEIFNKFFNADICNSETSLQDLFHFTITPTTRKACYKGLLFKNKVLKVNGLLVLVGHYISLGSSNVVNIWANQTFKTFGSKYIPHLQSNADST